MLFPFLTGSHRLPRRLDLPDAEDFSSDELAGMTEAAGLATRVAAARALAERKDTRAFPVLVEGLGNRHFRYAALEGLRMLGDARAREHALQVMDKAFAGVFERTQAAGILIGCGDPRGTEHIMERLSRRKRDDDRGLAIEIAAEEKLHEALPLLEEMAQDQDDLFRGAALKALAVLEPRRFEPLLCGIARNEQEDSDVRADVLEALAGMSGEQPRRILESVASSSCLELADLSRRLLSRD